MATVPLRQILMDWVLNPDHPETPRVTALKNVSGFRVMLSGNGGNTWAGGDPAFTKWSDLTGVLNSAAHLGTYGRPGANSTAMDAFWFREIPVLVRVDLKTRTVRQRTEYSSSPTAAAYAEQTQSLVLIPRHFGLPFNAN